MWPKKVPSNPRRLPPSPRRRRARVPRRRHHRLHRLHTAAAQPAPPRQSPAATPKPTAPPPPKAPATAKPAPPPPAAPVTPAVAPAGPAIRRFAREVGVDLLHVQGTGPGGRITREDVLAVVRQGGTKAVPAPAMPVADAAETAETTETTAAPSTTGPAAEASPAADPWGPIRVERATKIRKTIAAKMHESWSTVPRVTNFDDADVSALEQIRQASKADYASRGLKLTAMPFVIKSVAMALKKNPVLNASYDEANEQIVYKHYVNIGIAVDTDRGLVVPSLRRADELSIPEITRAGEHCRQCAEQ